MGLLTKAHCNACGPDRNHEVLRSVRKEGEEQIEEGISIWWVDEYELLTCAGCEVVTLRHTHRFSEDDNAKVTYYPPAAARRRPRWMGSLRYKNFSFDRGASTLHSLLDEIYVALDNDSRALAGMGIRAILDKIMAEKIGEKRTFKESIEAFEGAGHVSRDEGKRLDTIIEAGHAATHRSWRPSATDLHVLLDVMESIIERLYIHEGTIEELAKRVPARKREHKKAPPGEGQGHT
jgi:hypothetical protein